MSSGRRRVDYLFMDVEACEVQIFMIETIGNHWLCTPEPERIDVLH